MNKFNYITIGIVCFVLIMLSLVNKLYQNTSTTDTIFLPGEAHHTVGEMPIVEHFDDGDLGGRSGWVEPVNYPGEAFCRYSTSVHFGIRGERYDGVD